MKRRLPHGAPLASWLTLGGAALLFAGGLWSALHIAPLPEPTPSVGTTLAIDALAPDAGRDRATPLALSSDPFSVDRGLPDETEPDTPAPATETPPAPNGELRLLGTVVRANGSFALCQLPSDVPRIVHVGEQVGELTLISLDQGRAIFRARNGKPVELSLAKSGT